MGGLSIRRVMTQAPTHSLYNTNAPSYWTVTTSSSNATALTSVWTVAMPQTIPM